MTNRFIKSASILVLALFATESGYGQLADAPWSTFGQNLHNTSQSMYAGSAMDSLLWKQKLTVNDSTFGAWSTPAIGNQGNIYISALHGALIAFSREGNRLWEFKTDSAIYASPTIDLDGTIYVGTNNDSLYALERDGTLKWAFRTGGNIKSAASIDEEGTIYFGSGDGYLYALNPDGTLKWKFDTEHPINTVPAIDDSGNIYISTNYSHVFAVKPDGTKKWEKQVGNRVASSPTIGPTGRIYFGSDDGHLYALNKKGTVQWKYDTNVLFVRSSPAIGPDSTIYITSGKWTGNALHAINPDGTLKWKIDFGTTYASPTVDKNGIIYLGSANGGMYAINPDGSVKWQNEKPDWINGPAAIAENGNIYFADYDEALYAIGDGRITGIKDQEENARKISLNQNYPNPFNPTTTIKYTLPEVMNVSLTVYNLLGQQIANLVNTKKQAGTYTVTFDAGQLSSGVYIYKLQTESFTKSRKMMLVK